MCPPRTVTHIGPLSLTQRTQHTSNSTTYRGTEIMILKSLNSTMYGFIYRPKCHLYCYRQNNQFFRQIEKKEFRLDLGLDVN